MYFSYSHEIDEIYRLRDMTVVCAKCKLRLVIDVTQPGIKYCKCHDVEPLSSNLENSKSFFSTAVQFIIARHYRNKV